MVRSVAIVPSLYRLSGLKTIPVSVLNTSPVGGRDTARNEVSAERASQEMTIVILSVQKNESLLDGIEVKLPGVLQEFLALAGVHDQPRHVKRPGHPRKQKPDLAISLLIVRALHVFRRASGVLDEKVEKCTSYFGGTPADFRGQRRDRTPVRGVVAMLKAQVRGRGSPQLPPFPRLPDRRGPVTRPAPQTLVRSRNEQLLLAAE